MKRFSQLCLLVFAGFVGWPGSLAAADEAGPGVAQVLPAPGHLAVMTNLTVTFTETVVGVEAEDLLINGEPALSVSGWGAVYSFGFSQPASGLVRVSFDADHGITDLAGNPFDASATGASWVYQLLDSAAPTLLRVVPVAGSAPAALTQAEIVFTEPVEGVLASALLVNGSPATHVTGELNGPYRFSFLQPIAGPVNFSWTPSQGIRDLASNAFAGAGWSCVLEPGASPPDVIISEILADNESATGLRDAEGELVDWIELFNRGPRAVDLLGWSLSDDPDEPGLWTFPSTNLAPGQCLVVFASGKDRREAGAGLHTSFALNRAGGYLGLFDASSPRRVVSELAPAYPPQRVNYSYGRDASDALRYFVSPTPGLPNGLSGITDAAEPVHFSVQRGWFDGPFALRLTTSTPGAAIRYTADGSEPTAGNGSDYGAALVITNTVIIRAAAFATNQLPSVTRTHTYLFPEQVLQQPTNPPGFPSSWTNVSGSAVIPGDYAMDPRVISAAAYTNLARQALTNLPTLSIALRRDDLFSRSNGIYANPQGAGLAWERPASAEFLFADGADAQQVDLGYRIQGGTSREPEKAHKHSTRMLFRGAYGAGKWDYPFFADSPVARFDTLLVDAFLNLVWTHRYDATQRRQGQYVRDAFVSDLHNAMGWPAFHSRFVHLYLDGLYWGLHSVHERPDEDFAATYYGGAATNWDVLKNTTSFEVVQGNLAAWNAMMALANAGLTNDVQYRQLQQFLDVPNLIDYMILNIYTGNTDWPHHNWYAARLRETNATFKFLSWDAEHVLKDSVTYNNSLVLNPGTPAQLYDALRRHNPEFRLRFADHVHRHFYNNGLLTPARVQQFYEARIAEIDPAIVLESARWGDNAANTVRPNQPYERNYEWMTELNRIRTSWFPRRSGIVLTQFCNLGLYPTLSVAPLFNQHGGRVPRGFQLLVTNNPAGTVYFTTNNVDPRVYLAGVPSPDASVFNPQAPPRLGQTLTVKARTLNGTNWSALNAATFLVDELGVPLRVTEIMYHPVGGDAFEFLELRNEGARGLDVGGFRVEPLGYVFPFGTRLAASATVVLASDQNPAAFAARHPGVLVLGWFPGSLPNGGGRIEVTSPSGALVLAVDYDDEDGWPVDADGGGYSLEAVGGGDPDSPASWRPSATLHGTPGFVASPASTGGVLLNELMADNLGAVTNEGIYPDWVELHNPSAAPVSLAGWSLTDDGNPRKFVFPAGTEIPAGGHLVVWCDERTSSPQGLHAPFQLSRQGESVFLFNAATQRVDAVGYGLQIGNLSVGRIHGEWQLTQPTPNEPNAPAELAAQTNLVLNEWLANAAPGTSDWFELYNRSSSLPVSLQGLYVSCNDELCQMRSLSFVAAGGFVRLFADELPGAAHVDFKLPATGATLALHDNTGFEMDRLVYGAQVESVSEGRLPDGAANIVRFVASPSPGASNYVIAWSGPVLNEVLARNGTNGVAPWGETADWIEIANTSAASFDLTGLSMGEAQSGPGAFVFPPGSVIAGNGYLRLWCDGSRPPSIVFGPDLNTGFALSGTGGGLCLFDTTGRRVDGVDYGFQLQDRSLGRSEGQWCLLSSPTPGAENAGPAALGDPAGLRLNEWCADAVDGPAWFELFNTNAFPVALEELRLTDDPSILGRQRFTFRALSFIDGRDFVKLIADGQPGGGPDHVSFGLDKQGEGLRLYGPGGEVIDAIDYGVLAPGASEGRLPDGVGPVVVFSSTPSPGESNHLPLPEMLINEILTHTDAPLEDAIELFNPGPGARSIGGWYLSDDPKTPRKFRIPDGVTIPAGGFKVFYQAEFGGGGADRFAFSSARGGVAWLSETDGAGELTGRRTGVVYGPAENGVSFGRHSTSIGVDYPPMSARSFGVDAPPSLTEFRLGTGLTNPLPRVGPVVINEVMYHAVDDSGAGAVEVSDAEYLELHNLTGAAVALFDAQHPSNTWRLRGGVDFDLPAGTNLPPHAYLLIVGFDPQTNATALANFRTRYGLPADVPVLGPWHGRLDNAAERLELLKPDSPQGPGPDAGFVPYVLVDRLDYADATPWPTDADGGGASLQRRRPWDYGNDPAHWKAAPPSPGRANVEGAGFSDADADGIADSWELTHGLNPSSPADAISDADADGQSNLLEFHQGTNPRSAFSYLLIPRITQAPQPASAGVGSVVALSVTVAGTTPLGFQWRKDGWAIAGATNDSLLWTAVRPVDAGRYSVAVVNAAGVTISDEVMLSVHPTPVITAQPQNARAALGGIAIFAVEARGSGPVRHQWRFQGVDLAQATNATLTITNVGPGDVGEYAVVVQDDVARAESLPAALTLVAPPVIQLQPESLVVRTGSIVQLRVAADGSPPFGYLWRRDGTTVAVIAPAQGACQLSLPNVQLAQGGTYSVLVTNAAAPWGTVTSNAHLTVVSLPVSRVGIAGTDVTLSAVVAGGQPLSVQWQRNSVTLDGQTNTVLAIPNAQPGDSATYRLLVTNTAGANGAFTTTLNVFVQSAWEGPEIQVNGSFRAWLRGHSNMLYVIQASTNLSGWQQVGTLPYTNGWMEFADPSATNSPRRYYRALQQP